MRRQRALSRRLHTELVDNLPEKTVFVDLLRYWFYEQDPDVPGKAGLEKYTPSYVAFLLPAARACR